ncbi:polysaccharide pyruvyl transferase family protein [Psychrobacter sp. Arc29]|uniref:polysaccharide pyruvyl transferase family protein n=1 Tax=Psychrobacter sp. Arc29 TaxID=3046690 RepID=UPI00352CC0B9
MKVGILTLPLWHNYGGILQAYALRLAIERSGHQAILIDVKREPLSKRKKVISHTKRSIKAKFLYGLRKPYYPNEKEVKSISSNTRAFVENNIQPSSGHIRLSNTPKFAKRLDAIIVGSDQVWRPEYCPDLALYFLGFAKKRLKKISYAASLGTDDWRFDTKETTRCSKLLRTFDAVSVREESAIDLLKKNMQVAAIQTCDPTMLLEAKDYLSVADIPSTYPSGGRGIFCYVLDPKELRMQGLLNIGTRLNSELFFIMPKVFDKNYAKSSEDYIFPAVEEWIKALQESDFVVTDSFHGCVFSIIFNKPFIAIANTSRGRTRFESLLKQFDLEERLFDCVVDIDTEVLHKPLNWKEINKKRENLKNEGINFLTSSLNKES